MTIRNHVKVQNPAIVQHVFFFLRWQRGE